MSAQTMAVLFGLLCAAFALPSGASDWPPSSCSTIVDTFDTLPSALPVPLLDPVPSNYGGLLTYENFVYAAQPSSISSFAPASNPNIIDASVPKDTVDAITALTAAGQTISITPVGTIAAGPSIESFDLFAFYIAGVFFSADDAVIIGQSIVIGVVGYYPDGTQAPGQTYSYTQAKLFEQPMALAELPNSYRGVQNVTIGVVSAALSATLSVMALDNVTYCGNAWKSEGN